MKTLFRHVGNKNRNRKSSRRSRFARFEALESRQLLAADITGAVYNDVNGDGVHNNGEAGLANWTVFLDLDSNGSLDAGEPSSLTDADGKYAFRGLGGGGLSCGGSRQDRVDCDEPDTGLRGRHRDGWTRENSQLPESRQRRHRRHHGQCLARYQQQR